MEKERFIYDTSSSSSKLNYTHKLTSDSNDDDRNEIRIRNSQKSTCLTPATIFQSLDLPQQHKLGLEKRVAY